MHNFIYEVNLFLNTSAIEAKPQPSTERNSQTAALFCNILVLFPSLHIGLDSQLKVKWNVECFINFVAT